MGFRMKKKYIALVILLFFFIIVGIGFYKYIKFSKEYATTDAMFIRSDRITTLSFKRVSGKIIKLYVDAGDYVKKGELLAQLDPIDYKVKLKMVEDKINSLKFKKAQLVIEKSRLFSELNIKKQQVLKKIQLLNEKLDAFNFKIKKIEANLDQLRRDYRRFKNLYLKRAVAKRKYEDVATKLKALKNEKLSVIHERNSIAKQIEISKDDLKLITQEFKRVDELQREIESISYQISSLKQNEKDLKDLISYCNLYAPFDGKIGKKYAEVGMNVSSGFPIYSLVDINDLYVEVLLEETKLKGVKVGSPAYFKVDAYPDIEFKGVVEKIYPASAATYALVPRDISAGEFTKVAQRILIRVKITDGPKRLLISGMGGEIKIKRLGSHG